MVCTCCAPGCNSDQGKHRNQKNYPWMKNVTFHTFSNRNRAKERCLHKNGWNNSKGTANFFQINTGKYAHILLATRELQKCIQT